MIIRTAMMAIAALMGLVSIASAQDILTLNRQHVLTESAVGQHIAARIQAIGEEMDAELAPRAQQIGTEGQQLQAETQTLTPETIQQRPDLMQRIQVFEQNRQLLQRDQQIAVRELQATEQQALQPVNTALRTIVNQIAQERSASVVLERSSVYFAAASTDVTADIIQRLNATLPTVEVTISAAAPLDRAGPSELAFCVDETKIAALEDSQAGAIIAPEALAESVIESGASALVSDKPEATFAQCLPSLARLKPIPHDAPAIAPDARIAESARIGHGAVIGPGASIGENAVIGPHAVIGPGVVIGGGSEIAAHSYLICASIGERVSIGASCVIGGIGFGMAVGSQGAVEIPHLGGVRIDDDVRIGAACTIDRGRFDDTAIGAGTKIDNHCHIAHNVVIGRNGLIAAFAGISGSCVIGDGVIMAGRVGLSDHLTIGDGARLGADTAIMRDVPAGETWLGSPGKPSRTFFREVAAVSRLARPKRKRDSS